MLGRAYISKNVMHIIRSPSLVRVTLTATLMALISCSHAVRDQDAGKGRWTERPASRVAFRLADHAVDRLIFIKNKARVVVTGNKGAMIAEYDLTSKTRRWQKTSEGQIRANSIIAGDGFLIWLSANGTLHKIDEGTGSILWARQALRQDEAGVDVMGNPLLMADTVVLPLGSAKAVAAFDLTSGRDLASVGFAEMVFSSPVAVDGAAVVGDMGSTIRSLRIPGLQVRWEQNLGEIGFTPQVVGDRVFVSADDNLYCLDGRTGKILWKNRVGMVGAIRAFGSRVVVGNHGVLFSYDLVHGTYQGRTSLQSPGGVDRDPALDDRNVLGMVDQDGVLIVATVDGWVWGFDRDIKYLWSAHLGGGLVDGPVCVDEGILCARDDGAIVMLTPEGRK